jgi:hypothetical protein
VPPPPGTLSTTETDRATDAAGNTWQSTKTTYGNAMGAATDSTTTATTAPPAGYVTSTKRTTTTTTGGD